MLRIEGLRGLSLTDVMDAGIEKTYIVFCNTNEERWFNKYLKNGYQHCFILYYNGYNWFKLEHNYVGSDMMLITNLNGWVFNQCQNISRYYANLYNYSVLEVDRCGFLDEGKEQQRSKFILTPDTCVEYVKDFCFIRKYWLLTPWQLYKYIKNKTFE